MNNEYDDLEVGQVFRFGGPGSTQNKVIVALDDNWVYLDGIGTDVVDDLKVPRNGFLSNVSAWNSFWIITNKGLAIVTNRDKFIVGDYRGQ